MHIHTPPLFLVPSSLAHVPPLLKPSTFEPEIPHHKKLRGKKKTQNEHKSILQPLPSRAAGCPGCHLWPLRSPHKRVVPLKVLGHICTGRSPEVRAETLKAKAASRLRRRQVKSCRQASL